SVFTFKFHQHVALFFSSDFHLRRSDVRVSRYVYKRGVLEVHRGSFPDVGIGPWDHVRITPFCVSCPPRRSTRSRQSMPTAARGWMIRSSAVLRRVASLGQSREPLS